MIFRLFKYLIPAVIFVLLPFRAFSLDVESKSVRSERKLITEGNRLYTEKKYRNAAQKYQAALKENGSSPVARYNLGLSQIQAAIAANDTTAAGKEMKENGTRNLQQIAGMGSTKPMLASKANYNLGNVSFLAEDYKSALNFYKQALRLNPEDNAARRNLRITQLKMQNDQDNQNQDKNQDKQDQDKQDQKQDQNQDKNQQNQDNKDQNNDQQPKDNEINQQTADQILQAVENKENQTRARVNSPGNGEKAKGRNRSQKNW